MASLGIFPGGKLSFIQVKKSHQRLRPSPFPSTPVSNYSNKNPSSRRIRASVVSSPPPPLIGDYRVDQNQETIFSGNLDEWMRESVVDIVKNIKKAPLLVSVYSETDSQGNSESKFKTEKAIAENWPAMKDEWKTGVAKSPDGIIFVEELLGEEEKGNSTNKKGLSWNFGDPVEEEGGGDTKAWGILVQGRGVEAGPACYLLKTCRVGGGLGMGLFCTHFCLVRVKSFRETALGQLRDCWLLK